MAKAKFNINDLLNSQSKSSKAAEAKREAFKIENIPLDKLVPSSANLYGIREIEELAASIETMGLLHNLAVREVDGGKYEIISGERRYRACKMLYDGGNMDYAALPCKVEDEGSDAVAELKLIFANATARELTDFEKAEQAKRMKELFRQLRAEGYEIKGRLREIVADVLDVSPAQVGRLESVSEKLIPEFKEELKAGNIGISAAYDASTLPEEQQRETLDAYKAEGAEAIKREKARASQQKQAEKEHHEPVKEEAAEELPEAANQEAEKKPKTPDIESIMRRQQKEGAAEAVRQLRAVADNVPYDATCDVDGEEINMRAACINAARILEAI